MYNVSQFIQVAIGKLSVKRRFITAWSSRSIPTKWKKACAILFHKKGETNTPSYFRPVALEHIALKVFTSCLRNVMYLSLTANNYVEQNIQKGFNPNISGTLEHNAQMANIIKELVTSNALFSSYYLISRMPLARPNIRS